MLTIDPFWGAHRQIAASNGWRLRELYRAREGPLASIFGRNLELAVREANGSLLRDADAQSGLLITTDQIRTEDSRMQSGLELGWQEASR